MALSMHTNIASLITQNTMTQNSNLLNTAMERLSTGLRVNSAADDAAGLQVANRLEAQTRGMSVAMRNAQDGISMMQTAEGAMDEATNILYRMNDLATQSANGSATATDRTALNAEYQELGKELQSIMANTQFGGQKLLSGGGFSGTIDFQIGASSAEKLSVDVSVNLGKVDTGFKSAAAAAKIDPATGKSDTAATAGDLGDILDQANAKVAMNTINVQAGSTAGDPSLLDLVGSVRSSLGANINRLEHTITNLGNMVENTTAAKGRIMDADFAVESANMTKNQMLMQAGSSVLSKSGQLSGMAMSLLR
ncbi:lateral flagellin LafA [Photobacterium sp. TY1-4]|uniref:lateral flagellin LafA n=1 Tax=Photobacterium sp. TY1-4 TaxID=2899122 RepID=UPI0021C03A8B|nr:lateral flagellin LafA [Photobacterium sp. TY1-4]UXI03069.1 lateral flagellin LafA [Photobacterium sp. TY1-4]